MINIVKRKRISKEKHQEYGGVFEETEKKAKIQGE